MQNIVRNLLVSMSCGIAFGLAWWTTIDVAVYYPEIVKYKDGIMFAPIILSTVSLFVVSFIPNSSLYEHFPMTAPILFQRLVFFFGMTIGFAGFFLAIILCTTKDDPPFAVYANAVIPLATLLMLVANITFKFGLAEEEVC